jgi:hypothetical protein
VKKLALPILLTVSAMLVASPVLAHDDPSAHDTAMTREASSGPDGRSWGPFDDVRVATGAYHSLEAAIGDGFVPFDVQGGNDATCFDSEAGGMGVHYVRHIDGTVAATDPESLVYELTPDGQHRLVAVEYIVPQEFVEDEAGAVVALPGVLGQEFHKHPTLPVYILHAWVWESNPDGIFADFNPNVAACDDGSSPASGSTGTRTDLIHDQNR